MNIVAVISCISTEVQEYDNMDIKINSKLQKFTASDFDVSSLLGQAEIKPFAHPGSSV